MKKVLLASAVSMALVGAVNANEHSGTYAFDKKGAHQFITFKISHLGYSWLYGRFNDFDGEFECPEASFKSKRVVLDEEGEADIIGDLTLRGVTKEVTLDAEMLGHGEDPWGGYRMGFEAETELRLKDFGIPMDLGKTSETVEIIISVEGIRQ